DPYFSCSLSLQVMAEQELPGVLILDIGGTQGVLANHVALLKKHFCLITMKEFLANKKEMSKKIQSVFVFECRPTIDRELLESLPNLKVIANSGVGVDHLDVKMISSFGVKVTNTPQAVADSTADIGMALMLASARRLVEGCQIAISPDTEHFAVDWLGVEVTGATLGIIGMGSIGYKVAQRAKAFEMKILYHNRNRREEEQAVGAHYCEKMDDLLQQSDFVVLVVNLSPETHKLIGKRELGLMKPTATLINISRGRMARRHWCGSAVEVVFCPFALTLPSPTQMGPFPIYCISHTRVAGTLQINDLTQSIQSRQNLEPYPNDSFL
uniref:Probable 2-ketogluconate reductase n=1 Tax=Nothoprocta perdicaria TaxID=30464 RepID=A0A8C6YSN7_NOTPE